MRAIERNDLDIYERYGEEWWCPNSTQFRSLQSITPFRLQTIERWCGSLCGKRVLDLGCGGGLLSVPLLEQSADVVGVDISEASLKTAKIAAKGRGQFLRADVRNLPLESEQADVVLLADVLDHLPDYERALAEAARLLKKGGKLYVNTINRTFRSWLLAIVLGEGLRLIPPGTHDHSLFIAPDELQNNALQYDLHLQEFQGERPHIGRTLRRWAIHFVGTKSLAVAYSACFEKSHA